MCFDERSRRLASFTVETFGRLGGYKRLLRLSTRWYSERRREGVRVRAGVEGCYVCRPDGIASVVGRVSGCGRG